MGSRQNLKKKLSQHGKQELAWEKAQNRFEQARPFAFGYNDKCKFPEGFQPKSEAHNDGHFNGLSVGGIGAGNFGRDLHGHFSRWHLQCGHHCRQLIDAARLCIRWQQGDKIGFHQLGTDGWSNPVPEGIRNVHILFPMTWEHYSGEKWPFEMIVEIFSPVIPHDYDASSLPVVFFDFYIRNNSSERIKIDTAFFWPNLLGWRPSMRGPKEREGNIWPDHSHAGNQNIGLPNINYKYPHTGVLFQRNPDQPVKRDMEGEFLLIAHGNNNTHLGNEITYTGLNTGQYLGMSNQKYTLGCVEDYFKENGELPGSQYTWRAHWNEPIGGAVKAGQEIAPGESSAFSFLLAWDLPLVQFGSERCWEKKYCEKFGTKGNNAVNIAEYSLQQKNEWRDKIISWQQATLKRLTAEKREWKMPNPVAGSLINELYYIRDGGSTWVSNVKQSECLQEPCLGKGEHYAVLEGFDNGYYFYSTEDLWRYAFMPFMFFWPKLADLVFKDFLLAIPLELPEERVIYKTAEISPLLIKGKVPHDIGSPPEDPWHLLNGYNQHNNSNLWKDHNSSYIISLYLFRKIRQRSITQAEWGLLKMAGDFMLKQDKDGDGLPEHDTFGDSTWDAFEMQGVSAYSGGFVLGALAAMKSWAKEMDDIETKKLYDENLNKATKSYNDLLWNGEYYRLDSQGEYKECILADSLLGPYLAKLAGLGDLLPDDRIKSHLRAVYKYNFKKFENGCYGPLLIAGKKDNFKTSDKALIGEVLVGSAWASIGMMYAYGLLKEAEEMALSMHRVLYQKSGLQFRTPAAWNVKGFYRAPLNLRPLAIWFLDPLWGSRSI